MSAPPRISIVVAVLAVCDCSLIADTGRLVGDGRPVPSGQDAGSEIDGAPVASDAGGDVAAAPFCAPFANAAFCDDFDKTLAVERWSDDGLSASGSLALVRDQGEAFLRATLVSATTSGAAFLYRGMPSTPPTRIRFSFRIRTDRYPTEDVHACGIEFPQPDNVHSTFRFEVRKGSFAVFEQRKPSGFAVHELTEGPLPGTWRRIELGIAWDEQPARLTVNLDGKQVMSQPSVTDIPRVKPAVIAGASWASPTPALVIDVDDVLVEME
jgi:hypothetical protein